MVDVLDRAITAAVGGGGVRRVPITAQFPCYRHRVSGGADELDDLCL